MLAVRSPTLQRKRSTGRPATRPAPAVTEALEGRRLLSAGGDLDPTFGAGGRTTLAFPAAADPADPDFADDGVSLSAIDSRNGMTVIAGSHVYGHHVPGTPDFSSVDAAVVRLTAAGRPDPSFGGGDGLLYLDAVGGAADVFVLPDNKILLVGSDPGGGDFSRMLRLTADGTLDLSFGGGDGAVEIPFGAYNVQARDDGKIVLGGSGGAPADGTPTFAAARLNPDGAFDPTFGTRGVALPGVPAFGAANGLALAPGGGVVLGGVIRRADDYYDLGVLRLRADGSLDPSFGGGDGAVTLDVAPDDFGGAVAVAADGSVLVGRVDSGQQADEPVLARLRPDGSLDRWFAPLP
ncbi:MAG: hypothetical protein JWO31_2656, partial [Phycisphaerales bacterium]|nr:hypothetical protein [Phycisphaerales bacterium]